MSSEFNSSPTSAATDCFTIETVGRKAFSGRLMELMHTDRPAGAIKADREFEDIYWVEVFNSPDGLVVALHEFKSDPEPWLDVVHVVRPVAPQSESVTGRDGYVLAKALLYAIDAIQHLPREMQERSDMVDMCALARAVHGGGLADALIFVEAHTGREIDLWPDDEDRTAANATRARINTAKAAFEAANKDFYDAHPNARPYWQRNSATDPSSNSSASASDREDAA
ncbi:hypothetical protein LB518_24330 [Mesorhizobium sp. BR1-1-16]|uniref:hypothetical protein n=1 Tax=Mesorhizobium sp. BR1-1-16 TaxID=2876653 RepID=UPI001CC93A26|nr:hypothetical protein [Mesorhizobium sp. BR1-1-16]MBZ9939436.1 hypothetical protein [Mesorhizobium sp. BR1-1-16]